MRLINPLWVLAGWSALSSAITSPSSDNNAVDGESTRFNGEIVPPMLELTPDNWDAEFKASKYLMVKYYSPNCPHCIRFKPIFQTLYEFYYTQHQRDNRSFDVDFTTRYDFRFASVNCLAYYDLCSSHDIISYPTVVLYKDGESVDKIKGEKEIKQVSDAIEAVLEKDHPSSRPSLLLLPEPLATSAPQPPTKLTDDDVVVSTDEAPKSLQAFSDSLLNDTSRDAAARNSSATAAASKSTPAAAATTVSTISAPAHTPAKLAKLEPVPNLDGISVPLNAETFQRVVTMTQDSWFVKFYAPWCHACQSMAPNWQQLAKHMQRKLNVGEVNCDVETRLCKDVALRGYPTIMLFKGGERLEYDGLRGLGDFVQFAEKAIDVLSGVPDVDAATFREMEQKAEAIFVYFYDHATTSEDFMALDRLPFHLIGHAKLVKTCDKELYDRFKITTWPRLIVSREARPTYFNPLTPQEMRNVPQILAWIKSVWQPIVAELKASNAREIMDNKIVVLGILNRDDHDAFMSARREMKSAANEWMDKQIQLFQLERQELRDAKQLRIEEAEDRGDQRALRAAKSIRINMDKSDHKEVAFAWVDGVFWQRWIRTTYGIDVKDGERVIINDEDNRQYWDQTTTGNAIIPSRTSILETLNKVTAQPPKLKPKFTISSFEKALFDMRVTFSEHPYLTLGCIMGLSLGMASWFRGRTRRPRGHFRLDDNFAAAKDLNAPLLGANANGKVD